jgi:large subunit ribosomal protein L9
MKVILTQDIETLGKQREVVEVKAGYANNYLIKNGLALPANTKNMDKLNGEIAQIAAEQKRVKDAAEEVKKEINGKSVKITQSSGPDGKLYGAVTTKDVADAIVSEINVHLDKRKINMEQIKAAGTYPITVKLHSEVEAEMFVVVVGK